jgi:hypothetical protein
MIVLPDAPSPINLADWLEVSLLRAEDDQFRIADVVIRDVIEEADLPDVEVLFAGLAQTVRLRTRIVGDAYPIARDGLGYVVRGSWRDYLLYSFLLFLSLNQIYKELRFTKGSATKVAEIFEGVTAVALQQYMRCEVFRIGAPRRKPVPASFPVALENLAKVINEAVGQRDLEHQHSGDDGVDLIAWRTFGDDRAGQELLLAQCAIGTDWRRKRSELDLELWRRHIDWHSWPIKGFAVPFHHEPGNSWRETTTRAGLVLDRLRIARFVEPGHLYHELRTKVEGWCQTRLTSLAKLAIE